MSDDLFARDILRHVDISDINSLRAQKQYADCVVLSHDHKILMQYRPTGWSNAGGLNLFGGHVEKGEAISDALKRELHEELGAKVMDHQVKYIGSVSEAITDHQKIVHIYFWHDVDASIMGCYEAELRQFASVDAVLACDNVMEYARWALCEAVRLNYL